MVKLRRYAADEAAADEPLPEGEEAARTPGRKREGCLPERKRGARRAERTARTAARCMKRAARRRRTEARKRAREDKREGAAALNEDTMAGGWGRGEPMESVSVFVPLTCLIFRPFE